MIIALTFTFIHEANYFRPGWLGGRKGIRPVNNLGGCGGGGAVSPVGVAPIRTVGTSASIIFSCSIKIQRIGGGETQPECSIALC